MGFVSIRNINIGDEVVWDYGVREEWGRCRLVDGVVLPEEPEDIPGPSQVRIVCRP